MIYVLDFRDQNVGGPVMTGELSRHDGSLGGPLAEFELRTSRRVVFLIHGFNVCRSRGRRELGFLARYLTSAKADAIVAVLWPGDHWINFASYPLEGRDADDSAIALARFIDRVIPPVTALSFVAHSKGARVAMEAITGLLDRSYEIQDVCLMAAAIDDDSLASSEYYRSAVQATGRVAVLSSKKDLVLMLAYPAGDLLQSFLFMRDSFGWPLGFNGPRADRDEGGAVPGNVIPVAIPNDRKSNHGHYIPTFDPGHQTSGQNEQNQRSAAEFVNDLLAGDPNPRYQ